MERNGKVKVEEGGQPSLRVSILLIFPFPPPASPTSPARPTSTPRISTHKVFKFKTTFSFALCKAASQCLLQLQESAVSFHQTTHNPTLSLPSIYTSQTISDFNPHELSASDGDAS